MTQLRIFHLLSVHELLLQLLMLYRGLIEG